MALDRYRQLLERGDILGTNATQVPDPVSTTRRQSSTRTASQTTSDPVDTTAHRSSTRTASQTTPDPVNTTAQRSRTRRTSHTTPLATRPDAAPSYGGNFRLVIGLDFGTTFTGVAYATPRSNQASLNDIVVMDNWGGQSGNHPKIATIYSYTPGGPTGGHQWGANLSENAITIENIKLELDVQPEKIHELELILRALDGTHDLNADYLEQETILPEYTWKDAEEIMKDYLTKVFACLNQELHAKVGELLRSHLPVDIVVTIPTEWSYRAKNSTFRAITNAGFSKQNFKTLNEVLMVTEPEAAAIYTARHLREERNEEFLNVNDCFLLCDAGGGTVDVVCYRVIQLQPTLQLEQLTNATGQKCGSTYIDLAFKHWLHQVLGDQNFRILEYMDASEQISAHTIRRKEMRKVMARFEYHKRRFSNGVADMKIDLPTPLSTLNIGNAVNNGTLRITSHDMKMLFYNTVNSVLGLVDKQIKQVEAKNYRVKDLFLVGGFGESAHLQEELNYSLRIRRITIRRPESLKSWTAVVRGAVVYGIEKNSLRNKISARPCAMSHCLVLNDRYSEQDTDAQDRYRDPITHQLMARSQMVWFVRRGDLLGAQVMKEIEKPFTFAFFKRSARKSTLSIYAYPRDTDDVPDRFETGKQELVEVAQLNCDLSHMSLDRFERRRDPANRYYYLAHMTCKAKVTNVTLEVEIFHNHEKICSAQISDLTSRKAANGPVDTWRVPNMHLYNQPEGQRPAQTNENRGDSAGQAPPQYSSLPMYG